MTTRESVEVFTSLYRLHCCMKNNFLLTLLTLTGLFLGTNTAFAATGSSIEHRQNITNLSQTIAKSIDLDGSYQGLIESAIDRALLAKAEKVSNSTPANIAVGEPNGSIINGKIANPRRPIVNGKVINPHQPIINGRIANPKQPIINGIIINPNRR
jgi:hypothetical protein